MAASGSPAAIAASQAAEKTVWSGVYTEPQAQRGQALYRQACSYCHMDSLEGFGGDTIAAGLRGARFFVRWRGQTLAEMFDIISETMPPKIREDNLQKVAVTLDLQAYVDVMSYIFKVNGMPAGDSELFTDRTKLAQIMFTNRPNP